MTKSSGSTVAALLSWVLVAVSGPWPQSAAAATNGSRQALATQTQTFALSLANAAQLSGNFVFSPYNAALACALVQAGARGQTAAQLQRAVGWPEQGAALAELYGQQSHGWAQQFAGSAEAMIRISNALWVDDRLPLQADFAHLLAAGFGAQVQNISFADPGSTARAIDAWSDAASEHHIKHLLTPQQLHRAAMVLASVIYFKAPWGAAFAHPALRQQTFHVSPEQRVEVPFVAKSQAVLPFAQVSGWRAVQIPYEVPNLSLLILVPDHGDLGALSADVLTEIYGALRPTPLRVSFPVVRFSTKLDLKQLLQQLGVRDAFGPAANFSAMVGTQPLFLSQATHQAYIAINEHGTEASAATSLSIATLSLMRTSDMTVDRPYVFIVQDSETHMPLFFGAVRQPAEMQ